MKKEKTRNRVGGVLEKLRLYHLSPEENEKIGNICSDYHDTFYLPGDKVSFTNAIKYSINVMPGTNLINTKPYILPKGQNAEIDKQAYYLEE
jgi:hypothetical protein